MLVFTNQVKGRDKEDRAASVYFNEFEASWEVCCFSDGTIKHRKQAPTEAQAVWTGQVWVSPFHLSETAQ